MEHAGRRAACGGVVGVRAVRWLGSGQRAGGAGREPGERARGPSGASLSRPHHSTLFCGGSAGAEEPGEPTTDGRTRSRVP